MVSCWPPTTRTAVRACPVVFEAAVNLKKAFPEPLPWVTVIHDGPLVDVQLQPVSVKTTIDPGPPDGLTVVREGTIS